MGQGDLVLITGSTVWQQKAIKIKASDRDPVRKTNSHPRQTGILTSDKFKSVN